ncbi:MAG: hypothetical protein M0R21_00475 [Lentimicrobiaceae bacterium]|nr:hypothetical protein [Lentimicrobiaceae bacterium]
MTVVDYADRLRVVHNSSTKDYFIPNNSSDEWSSFENNLPTNVWLDIVSCDVDNFKDHCGSDCIYSNGYQDVAYTTTLIGSQCWMTKDLETYQNASSTMIAQWPASTVPTYNNRYACTENTSSCDQGIFYQWFTALPNGGLQGDGNASTTPIRGICPSGWHIPFGYEIDALAGAVSAHGCYNTTTAIFIASCLNTYYDFNVGTLYGYRYPINGSYLRRDNGKVFRTASYINEPKFVARNLPVTVDGYYSYGNYDGAQSIDAGVSVRCIKD